MQKDRWMTPTFLLLWLLAVAACSLTLLVVVTVHSAAFLAPLGEQYLDFILGVVTLLVTIVGLYYIAHTLKEARDSV